MSLFKNDVGRPSNEVLRKRKIFYSIIMVAVIGLVFAGGYFLKKHFIAQEISSNSQNATAKEQKFTLTAKTLNGNAYKTDTNTSSELKLQVVKNSNYRVKSYTWYKNGKRYSDCINATCDLMTNQIATYYVKVRTNDDKTYTTNKIKVRIGGKPTVGLDAYCGNKTCDKIGHPILRYNDGTNALVYKSAVTLYVKTRFIDVNSYTWYKDGKKYSACQNSTKCIVEKGLSKIYVVVKDKSGKKYPVYTDTEYIGVDSTKYSITGFIDGDRKRATYNSKKDLYTIKRDKTGFIIVLSNNDKSECVKDKSEYWYKLNTKTNKYETVKESYNVIRNIGKYKVVVKYCNGVTDEAILKVEK